MVKYVEFIITLHKLCDSLHNFVDRSAVQQKRRFGGTSFLYYII